MFNKTCLQLFCNQTGTELSEIHLIQCWWEDNHCLRFLYRVTGIPVSFGIPTQASKNANPGILLTL